MDLCHCQNVVDRMLTDGRTLAEIEEYVERCHLDDLERAGLWMLAWAHQDQATQLRLAKETLALASSTVQPTHERDRRRFVSRSGAGDVRRD